MSFSDTMSKKASGASPTQYEGCLTKPPSGEPWCKIARETITNAPINYLQIWDRDFIYAYGWQNCIGAHGDMQKVMTSPPGCAVVNNSGIEQIAYLLNTTNTAIRGLIAEPVALPAPCGCGGGLVPRQAFPGDPVCVTNTQYYQVQADNSNANASSTGTYSSDYTVPPPKPIKGHR
jgi:hypothetical protein